MKANRRPGRPSRRRRRPRAPLRFDTAEGLEEHRELEYLRVCAIRPRRGEKHGHRERIERRGRKLKTARRDFDPNFGRRKKGSGS